MSTTPVFPQLQGQYINLTTFRKNGAGVATPVWFAIDGDSLYIVTQADSGKVKRIRNNPRVTMITSDGRGQIKAGASTAEGVATVLSLAQGAAADKALKAKYGWMYSAFGIFWRLRGITATYLAVRPA